MNDTVAFFVLVFSVFIGFPMVAIGGAWIIGRIEDAELARTQHVARRAAHRARQPRAAWADRNGIHTVTSMSSALHSPHPRHRRTH